MRRTIALLALLSGCRDFDAALADCTSEGRCGCAMVVTARTHHLIDGPGEVVVPVAEPMTAWLVDGGQRALATDGGGTYCLAGPLNGAVLLQVNADTFVQASGATADVSQWVRGRPDVVRATAGTSLEFPRLGTLAPPWVNVDSFWFGSDGAAISRGFEPNYAAGATNAGAQAIPIPAPNGLPTASDTLTLLRNSALPIEGWVTTQIARGNVEAKNGIANVVDAGAFTAVTLNRPLSLDWRPPTAAMRADLFPYGGDLPDSGYVDINLWADPHDAGYFDPTWLVAYARIRSTAPVSFQFDYGTPFPGSMSLTSLYASSYDFTAPQATSSESVGVSLFRALPHDTADAGRLEFAQAPQSLTLNQTPVGSLPSLAIVAQPLVVGWSTGAAQMRVEVLALARNGNGSTSITRFQTFYVAGMAGRLPLPALPAGQYLLKLMARTPVPFDPRVPLKPSPAITESTALIRPFTVE